MGSGRFTGIADENSLSTGLTILQSTAADGSVGKGVEPSEPGAGLCAPEFAHGNGDAWRDEHETFGANVTHCAVAGEYATSTRPMTQTLNAASLDMGPF